MTCIRFVDQRFNAATRKIIEQANAIVAEYMAAGFKLTLRQLYYQFVSRDYIPNTPRDYKRLGSIINDARLAGELDWDAIEDRGRNLQSVSHWPSPEALIDTCVHCFALDLWADQPVRPEVWIEKEALAGVIEPICRSLRVQWMACKGYMSQSEMFEAGYGRLRRNQEAGQHTVILHLGDHDPSGIDMTRDIRDRLKMFFGDEVLVKRLALNKPQVETYQPPPNPAKVTDVRFEAYQQKFGDDSWELDALEPQVISGLIEHAVLTMRDESVWTTAVARENEGREQLTKVRDRYAEVCDMLSKPKKGKKK